MIKTSYIDFDRNLLCVAQLFAPEYIEIPFGENESLTDLTIREEHQVSSESDFIDLLPECMMPDTEKEYDHIKCKYPWSIQIYSYQDVFIISDEDLLHSCPSMLPSLIAIPKSTFGLMAFVREYCLPFLEKK
jgi:hypothetical protein